MVYPDDLEVEIKLTKELKHLTNLEYLHIWLSKAHLTEWADSNTSYDSHRRALTEGYLSFRVLEILELALEDVEIYLQLSYLIKPDTLDLRDLMAAFLLDLRQEVIQGLYEASLNNELIIIH